jgi:hypothetical protein
VCLRHGSRDNGASALCLRFVDGVVLVLSH